MKQLYLKVREGEPPILALGDEPQPGEGVPADMVLLPGATVVATSRFNRDSSRQACAKIAELCRSGVAASGDVDKVSGSLDTTAVLLCDLRAFITGEIQLMPASAEVLITSAITELAKARNALSARAEQPPQAEPEPQPSVTAKPQETQWSPNSVSSTQDREDGHVEGA